MRTAVFIIGAGPYGIAVAQELWDRGVDFRIAGEPFSTWRHHTLGSMVLRSDRRHSEIYSRDSRYSLAAFAAAANAGNGAGPIDVGTFRDYLDDVVERLPFEVLRQRVEALEKRGDEFTARCSAGAEVRARAVVVATGLGPHRHLPAELRRLPAGRVFHSWEARRVEGLRGREVLVIGDGQSAAEAVAHLRARNRVTWSLRRKPRFCPRHLPASRPLFHLLLASSPGLHRLPRPARSRLTHRYSRATVAPELRPVYLDERVEKVFGDAADLGLRESAGRIAGTAGVFFDEVVAATGYCFLLGRLPFLDGELVRALWNRPGLDADFQTAVPGLHLVGAGAEASFGPAMRLLYGSRLAARRLGAALARQEGAAS